MRSISMLVACTAFVSPVLAQSDAAKRIQVRYEDAKPDAKQLAFYSLDWAMSLKDAKARAAKEHRPILVILNTNITAGINFYSGHTCANMDHVRGSSLVWPATLDTLRPFIMTWWSGRTVEDMPADIKAVYEAANLGTKHINIALVVLDENGKHLRATVPAVKPGALRFDPESQGKDFKRQLDELIEGLKLPKVDPPAKAKLTLPNLATKGQLNGVRIYLSAAENRLNHYRTPIVEAVPITDSIRKTLQFPDAATALIAKDLQPWLEQVYPAAIMDGKGGFRSIEGKLTFQSAGQDDKYRYAILEGKVDFELDNTSRSSYRGDLAFVLKYSLKETAVATLRGVIDCTVPKGPERIKLTAAVESLPE